MNTKLKEFSTEITEINDANEFIMFLSLNSAYNIMCDCDGLSADIHYDDQNIKINIQYDPDTQRLYSEISEIKNEDDASKAPRTWAFDSDSDEQFYLI
ncbi:hypothetical protein [Gluconobacter cerinus]|uniref:hypothetical protein n=1 Tax=Gluconobacter cerinus TaxID=38307 RepID=UPI001B8B4C54|nr:hypothetical protein [Gluconobacter cerinus]MBS0984341.1 hypothetical protein [Gluconobacter cerinus]